MRMRHRGLVALLLLPLISMGVATALGRPDHPNSNPQQCPLDGGVKVERAPWTICGSRTVCAVCIKAGQNQIRLTVDHPTDGCYTVTGLGTGNVTVTGGGTSRDCKDISNVVFYFGDCGVGPPG